MTISVALLLEWRNGLAAEQKLPMFMGVPDAWYDHPHWFCGNGHVSGRYLKSEAKSGACCLVCGEFVVLGPAIGETAFAPILAVLANITA